MRSNIICIWALVVVIANLPFAVPSSADEPMSLGQFPQDSGAAGGSTPSETTTETTVETKSEMCDIYGYKEVSDFFHVREANPQVSACEWEFELGADWATRMDGEEDKEPRC